MAANTTTGGAPKAAEPTKQYRVLQNLRHSGKHYSPGSTVKLTAKEAAGHIANRVVAGKVSGINAAEEAADSISDEQGEE